MHAAVDDKHYSYYAYDHSGGSCASREQSQACLSYAEMEQRRRSQRRLKLVGDNCSMDVNAEYMNASSALNKPTLYPSPYLVLSMNEYTKHYYAGAERVAACLGGGGLDIVTHGANHSSGTDPTGTSASIGWSYIGPGYEPNQPEASEEEELKKLASQLQDTANNLFNQSYHQLANRRLDQNDPDCLWEVDVYQEELRRPLVGIPDGVDAKVEIDLEKFRTSVIEQQEQHHDESEYVYYYHSDHLGSASWITDHDGNPVQHLQYLPYGEPYVDQRTIGYSERFRFTGKERDEETGYGYFGARYMDHELMTMWLSVDPMADKYPNISPYNYCAWNPVKLVDPDGKELTDFYDMSTGEHLKHVPDGIDEAVAISRIVFDACEEDNASTSFMKSMGTSLGRNSEFVALAGTLYAESTPQEASFEEMAGIGSVIRNRAQADNRSPINVASGGGIYGYNRRDKINNPNASQSKVNLAFKVAMLTLCTNTDYSNGAYFWQGNDFRVNNSPANNEYYKKGFDFTDNSHDRFGMGSNRVAGPVPYKYESTAAAAGTVFMRLTDNWKQAHGATKWNGQ